MEIFSAILIIALIAAVAFVVLRRQPRGVPGVARERAAPLGRRDRGVRRADPMAAAVADHAQATDPADVVAAEQRLRAEARNVAAGMQGSAAAAGPGYAGTSGYYGPASAAASSDPNLDSDFDRQTGQRVDGFEDPAADPRLADSRYDGRLAVDWVDPREDDRLR
jgi:hypothetical protein